MEDSLDVFWESRLVGRLRLGEKREFSFQYDPSWLSRKEALPLSVRLPKQAEPFGDERARHFFANLLPEARVRDLIAGRLGVSTSNDFKLLEALGGECAGAISLLPEGETPSTEGGYEPLSTEDLSRMIAEMPARPLLTARDGMRLSLAGAQNKLPVLIDDGRLFLPRGAASSSHILKPQIPEFADTVENEAFCMMLAERVGLPVPKADIWAGKAFLIERYDRTKDGTGGLIRVHQEDFCQSLGYGCDQKYQSEGGPGLKACFVLLEEHGAEPAVDKGRLLKWVVFNVLIGNCDAHAKNLSLLYTGEGIRLAPFYDLMSTRSYPGLSEKLAMKIGGENRPDWIMRRHWERMAGDAEVAVRAVLGACEELAESMPGAAKALAKEFEPKHGAGATIGGIVEYVGKSAAHLRNVLREK
ncbi:type II toxin-antitoxin system HipA family toxin [Elusimicrobiota bacterium]